MSLGERYRNRAADIVAKIDAVSRARALNDDESRLLEWAIGLVDGTRRNMRMPYRSGMILARLGIKRDMGLFRPNKKIEDVRRHTEAATGREQARCRK